MDLDMCDATLLLRQIFPHSKILSLEAFLYVMYQVNHTREKKDAEKSYHVVLDVLVVSVVPSLVIQYSTPIITKIVLTSSVPYYTILCSLPLMST